MNRKILYALLLVAACALTSANLWCGAIHIDGATVWRILTGGAAEASTVERFIVLESRLPAALTALLTGAALGVSGLLLQSYFRNPLAGPSILGITSGANLGVACVALWGVTSVGGLTASALLGAAAVLGMLLLLSRYVRQPLTLLIVGMMISYVVSALITLLNFYATAEGVQSFLLWGMGNFSAVGSGHLLGYALMLLIPLAATVLLVKPLNGWMLGELYARNLGVRVGALRVGLLAVTGLLAAVTTAFCGPISFIGLSAPHVARLMLRTDDHRLLLPATALWGGCCASACLYLSAALPTGGGLIPINALTPFFGVPVILYVLLRERSKI
jgi:iron complex transport system permease protein